LKSKSKFIFRLKSQANDSGGSFGTAWIKTLVTYPSS